MFDYENFTHTSESDDCYLEAAHIFSFEVDDTLELVVYGGDGNIPHFHFYRGESDENEMDGGCIMLTEARYFSHGKYNSVLTSEELEALADTLKSEDKYYPGTVWEALKYNWNVNNPEYEIPKDITMPDYGNISLY